MNEIELHVSRKIELLHEIIRATKWTKNTQYETRSYRTRPPIQVIENTARKLLPLGMERNCGTVSRSSQP